FRYLWAQVLYGISRRIEERDTRNDVFVSMAPQKRDNILHMREYQRKIRECGKNWIRDHYPSLQDVDETSSAENGLVELIWASQLGALHRIDPKCFVLSSEGTEYEDFTDRCLRLGDRLRDSMLRHKSPFYTMAFVGREDTATDVQTDGPTTAYPCHIRHIADQEVPELRLQLCSERTTPGQVKGCLQDMTSIASEDGGKSWEYALKRDCKTLLPQISVSQKGWRAWILRNLNDFVRICRALPVGFEHLEPSAWPVITMKFPNFQKGGFDKGLEGIGDSNSQEHWNEMIREVIRRADTVIGVVSLRNFYDKSWQKLPDIIRSCSSVEVAAVVMTMLDYGSPTEEELKRRKWLIKRAFWPPGIDTSWGSGGQVLACSSLYGPPLMRLKAMLEGGISPSWTQLWEPDLSNGSSLLYSEDGMDVFEAEPAEELKKRVQTLETELGLSQTINGLAALLSNPKPQILIYECKGIISLSKLINYDLRRMLAAVGKAEADVLFSPTDSANSNDLMELLDLWNQHASLFFHDIQDIAAKSSHNWAKKYEDSTNSVIEIALNELRSLEMEIPVTASSTLLSSHEFTERNNLKQYLDSYRENLQRVITHLDDVASKEFLQASHQAHLNRLSDLYSKIESKNPEAIGQWPSAVTGLKHPTIPLSEAALSETSSFVSEKRAKYTLNEAFSLLQERSLQFLDPGFHSQGRIARLSLISRSLLAAATTIPFLLSIPYWLVKTYVESYRLSIEGFRETSRKLAISHSSNLLKQLETDVVEYEIKETENAIKFISAKFSVPLDFDPNKSLPDLPTETIQLAVAANCDVLASLSAFDQILAAASRLT
ncbi:13630_t:CDS:10, partial [Acaulospora colombiana]